MRMAKRRTRHDHSSASYPAGAVPIHKRHLRLLHPLRPNRRRPHGSMSIVTNRRHAITVGGIRSTGLTASLGISRHVVQCLLPTIISPRVDESSPSTLTHRLRSLTPLPNADELVKQYHTRGDGTIIVGGYVYKVTHPLTKMGWDARTGLAAMKTKTNSGNL